MGADAIHFDLMGTELRIVGNGFTDISRAAISLNQTNLVISEDNKLGVLPENAHKFFDGVQISNNYIRYTGIDDIGAAVVYSEFTRNLGLFHNEIREVPTFAVRTSWRFLAWRGHTENIEYAWNRTSDVGQAGMEDYGALYISCLNIGEGSIHHNFVDGAGLHNGNAGIYLDVYVNNVKVSHNVLQNMPEEYGSMPFSGGWMMLIISEHNEIFNNWSDSELKADISLPDYRFWPSPTNKFYDNYFKSPGDGEWPDEAREVIAQTGLLQEYQFVKQAIDDELDSRGYIPLENLYTSPGKTLHKE